MINKKSNIFTISKQDNELWGRVKQHFIPLHKAKAKSGNKIETIENKGLDYQNNLDNEDNTKHTTNTGNNKVNSHEYDMQNVMQNNIQHNNIQKNTTTLANFNQPKVNLFNKKELKVIKQDKLKVDRYLDLHNYTLSQAEALFVDFISKAHANKYKLVLVITGKGTHGNKNNDSEGFYSPKPMGILKSAFFKWIEYDHVKKHVISYSKALPKDGGEGAFYIKIRS
jgi:DNA-nicking Smr family endonuclease